MNPLVYWIWLSLRCGAGSELGTYLLSHFKTPQAIYEASAESLRAVEGIDGNVLAALLDRDLTFSTKIVEYCERVNVGIMTMESSVYPERLRSIYAKPLVLYYRGKIPNIDDNVLIACVGTRKCSKGGEQTAYQLGAQLAHAGAIVVSGMALGIDAASQKGALSAGGHTIAVLGCGIDRIYPYQNKDLMERIAEKGTLITEFAPGTEPSGKNFPIRNRIISGLSQGTVVVEADVHSGSLITAKDAARQGRDIFAFPGDAGNPLSAGANMLIKNGAKLVTCAADILEDYELLYPHRIFTENISMSRYQRKQGPKQADDAGKRASLGEEMPKFQLERESVRKKKAMAEKVKEIEEKISEKRAASSVDTSGLDAFERELLSVVSDAMSAEEIAAALTKKTGTPTDMGTLLSALTMLEIGGYLEALPGGSFRPL